MCNLVHYFAWTMVTSDVMNYFLVQSSLIGKDACEAAVQECNAEQEEG